MSNTPLAIFPAWNAQTGGQPTRARSGPVQQDVVLDAQMPQMVRDDHEWCILWSWR